MRKFLNSKKFWFIVLALILIGFFISLFLFPETEIPQRIREREEVVSIGVLSVSSIYRYDFKEGEYVFDEGGSWQNSDFTRYIYDLAPEDRGLEGCYYFLYDNVEKRMAAGGQRKCNSNLTITVGENQNCLSQSKNACTLYVYAIDSAGRQGEYGIATYHIDWQRPEIGKPYRKNGSFFAEVSDNLEVSYCWLYLNGKNIGSMEIENGLAFLEYFFEEKESYSVFVRCADHYDAERNRYLNFASGEPAEFFIFKNRPPEITFCRVTPARGNLQTEFKFQVEAFDPDGDELFYRWNFGDGEISREESPGHYYSFSGLFEPEVIVSDGTEEVSCYTAWVVVE